MALLPPPQLQCKKNVYTSERTNKHKHDRSVRDVTKDNKITFLPSKNPSVSSPFWTVFQLDVELKVFFWLTDRGPVALAWQAWFFCGLPVLCFKKKIKSQSWESVMRGGGNMRGGGVHVWLSLDVGGGTPLLTPPLRSFPFCRRPHARWDAPRRRQWLSVGTCYWLLSQAPGPPRQSPSCKWEIERFYDLVFQSKSFLILKKLNYFRASMCKDVLVWGWRLCLRPHNCLDSFHIAKVCKYSWRSLTFKCH